MITVDNICEALTNKRLSEKLGVTPAAVTNAKSKGVFPAHWERVVRQECETKGLDCPDTLFNFIAPQTPEAAAE